MSGKCWVCKRQARGFGYSDNRHRIGTTSIRNDYVELDAFCAEHVVRARRGLQPGGGHV